MKQILKLIIFLLFAFVCEASVSAQTLMRYLPVYDVNENGAKIKPAFNSTVYVEFDTNKSYFYYVDENGYALGLGKFTYERTSNGIHYYYLIHDCRYPKTFEMNLYRKHFIETYGTDYYKEYVLFSEDYSRMNQEMHNSYYKDHKVRVFERAKDPNQTVAPSTMY